MFESPLHLSYTAHCRRHQLCPYVWSTGQGKDPSRILYCTRENVEVKFVLSVLWKGVGTDPTPINTFTRLRVGPQDPPIPFIPLRSLPTPCLSEGKYVQKIFLIHISIIGFHICG